MENIKITTLIDITDSKQPRVGANNEKEHNQYKNWQTLLQCIGLRCNIEYETSPQQQTLDIKNLGFGTNFKGKQRIWTFMFQPDRSYSYSDQTSRVGLLVSDLHLVPVFQNLDETINISKSAFDTIDPENRNTLVELLQE